MGIVYENYRKYDNGASLDIAPRLLYNYTYIRNYPETATINNYLPIPEDSKKYFTYGYANIIIAKLHIKTVSVTMTDTTSSYRPFVEIALLPTASGAITSIYAQKASPTVTITDEWQIKTLIGTTVATNTSATTRTKPYTQFLNIVSSTSGTTTAIFINDDPIKACTCKLTTYDNCTSATIDFDIFIYYM